MHAHFQVAFTSSRSSTVSGGAAGHAATKGEQHHNDGSASASSAFVTPTTTAITESTSASLTALPIAAIVEESGITLSPAKLAARKTQSHDMASMVQQDAVLCEYALSQRNDDIRSVLRLVVDP